jgi:hypothetical protein
MGIRAGFSFFGDGETRLSIKRRLHPSPTAALRQASVAERPVALPPVQGKELQFEDCINAPLGFTAGRPF